MATGLGSIDVGTVLDDLVQQFSNPLAFFRELVQNAIDAGSGEIEIWFDFEREEQDGANGQVTIHVRDFGEGMDRELIEGRLTRLFSSGKDDDYTKIGRFGIGFVSVFAIEPEVVCVDTGRSGEYWRVLFDESRNFELIKLDRPVEGTHVRVFEAMTDEEFQRFVGRARLVVRHWCKHARVPILFEGEDIRMPFEVGADCQVRHEEEGTRLVMGIVESPRAPFGFYNRGLTLKEGEDSSWWHIAFKIDSRYLEHTLTRDQVIEDENYRKAKELLEKTAFETLPAKLLDELEAAAADSSKARRHDRLSADLARYSSAHGEPADISDRKLIPRMGGGPVSIGECREADGDDALYLVWESDTDRAGAFVDDRLLVPLSGPGGGLKQLFDHFLGESPPVFRTLVAMPRFLDYSGRPGASRFRGSAVELLGLLGAECNVEFARIFEHSPLASEIALPLDSLERPSLVEDVPSPSRTAVVEARQLLVNCEHELVDELLDVAADEPEWAALQFVKLLCRADLTPAEDRMMVEASLGARAARRRTSD